MFSSHTSKRTVPSVLDESNNIGVADDASDLENVDERIRERRAEILQDLQRQLEELMDRHDDLVGLFSFSFVYHKFHVFPKLTLFIR